MVRDDGIQRELNAAQKTLMGPCKEQWPACTTVQLAMVFEKAHAKSSNSSCDICCAI